MKGKLPDHVDVVVSPEGDDNAEGTWQQPVRTLPRAQQLVRERLQADPDCDRHVVLRGGTYPVHETIVLSLADAPGPAYRVYWEAAPGEQPVLSAGVPLGPWQRLTDAPAHLAAAARGKVWYADLPDLAGDVWPRGLYKGERRLPRARGKGFAPLSQPDDEHLDVYRELRVPEGAVEAWPDLTSSEIVIITRRPWKMDILPVAGYDPQKRVLRTTHPCTYEMTPNKKWEESVWVENVLAVLDQPGEWVYDREQRRVYLWPDDGDAPGDDIVATVLSEMIRMEGEIDEDAPRDVPVCNLTLRGLRFICNNRTPWYGRTGMGMQHDWEAHDRPTAAVRLRGASNCVIEACHFAHGEGAAIRLDLHAERNRIVGNHIEDLGGAGIVLGGYGPGTKDVNRRNQILNNHIHHIGRTTWHAPGIFLWQSGENRVAHNHVHHTPYTGIVCSGRIQLDPAGKGPCDGECQGTIRWDEALAVLGEDYIQPEWHQVWKPDWDRREPLLHARRNVIELNDLHDVMEVLGDGNAIYISGGGGGNVVRANHVHDCVGPHFGEAIRCDDDQHETLIEGNLVHHFAGKLVGICVKGLNAIVNNVVACPLSSHPNRGLVGLLVGPLHDMPLQRNIIYATGGEHNFYSQRRVRVHGDGPQPLVRDCDADANLYWNTADPEQGEAHLEAERRYGVEHHSRCADPLFADPENGDFTLAPDSPARAMGIEPLETDRAGLTDGMPFCSV
ncbi:MAG: right-handed parallel beta-helix repeat-containing protein [Thioalkalivibrio sp.]|nr:right-handed parallel beta-helix repeat-containing protein [Thioalkalivibrio sp.]